MATSVWLVDYILRMLDSLNACPSWSNIDFQAMGELVRKIGRSKERLGYAVHLQNGSTLHSAMVTFKTAALALMAVSEFQQHFPLDSHFSGCVSWHWLKALGMHCILRITRSCRKFTLDNPSLDRQVPFSNQLSSVLEKVGLSCSITVVFKWSLITFQLGAITITHFCTSPAPSASRSATGQRDCLHFVITTWWFLLSRLSCFQPTELYGNKGLGRLPIVAPWNRFEQWGSGQVARHHR